TEVAGLIGSREVSPVDLTQALLDHAHELNNTVNSYISFRDDQALAEAKQAEDEIAAGNYRGPLHGIPMAIKDNIYIGGEVSTWLQRFTVILFPRMMPLLWLIYGKPAQYSPGS